MTDNDGDDKGELLVDFSEDTPRQAPSKGEFVYHARTTPRASPPGEGGDDIVMATVRIHKFKANDPEKDPRYPIETYVVTLYWPDRVQNKQLSAICSCQGFQAQKYNKQLHKHVVLAKEHHNSLTEHELPHDTVTEFMIKGKGKDAKVQFNRFITNNS